MYRFFLFSDELLYGHQTKSGEYKVHGQLNLLSMTIKNIDNDPTGCSFQIEHPTKTFVVVAESPQSKQEWIREIEQTATNCKKRVAAEIAESNGGRERRISIYSRIEVQQDDQIRDLERKKNIISLNSPQISPLGTPMSRNATEDGNERYDEEEDSSSACKSSSDESSDGDLSMDDIDIKDARVDTSHRRTRDSNELQRAAQRSLASEEN